MKKNELGNTGIYVSTIGFGVLTIGENQLNLPLQEGAELIRYGMEKGINFFDTAQYYKTYPYLREALKSTNFDPVICTKCLDTSASAMNDAIEEARTQLDRDVIDIFLLHEVRNHPDFQNRSDAWEALQNAKNKGIVKAIGISTHHVDVMEQMVENHSCDVLFPLINIEGLGIRKGDHFGDRNEMVDAIRRNHKNGKGIFSMKAFGGGNLVQSYTKCLDYVTNISSITSVMIGFGRKAEIDRAIDYTNGNLPADYMPDITNKKIMIDPGDCEGCQNCLFRCPNHAISMNAFGIAEIDQHICLKCGYCAPVCPTRAIILC